jgi:hypothetical protein
MIAAGSASGCVPAAPMDAVASHQAEDAIDRAVFGLHASMGYKWHNPVNDPQSVSFGNPAERAEVQFRCTGGTLSISFPARADHRSGERATLMLPNGETIRAAIIVSETGPSASFSMTQNDPSVQSLLLAGNFRFVTPRTDQPYSVLGGTELLRSLVARC